MHPPRNEPAALLRQAHLVLTALQPAMTASFHSWGEAYRARFDYPGIVSVFHRNTGELVARSRRGRPTEPAALPRARGHRGD
jgi:2-oxo-4-hydroxy-4-carboxy--5-ureidoimidazoline (OHCU) decarboxylase